jgi:mannose-6-phosphate isomerase-like protein (cupin superfamily)
MANEFFIDEGCHIVELHNTPSDPTVSIARARVERGVATALHTVDVDEKYFILAGEGRVEVGEEPTRAVGPGALVVIPRGVPQRITNISDGEDLVFLCICTPRFQPSVYRELEPRRRK